MKQPNHPIPVFVLTGFLGSGKTTLLNAILKDDAFANSAVIINEFGEIGLDHHLVETGDDTIIELSNGCLCCTVRGQLIETIAGLLPRTPERILIETTGLADPVPVLQALIASPDIKDEITFNGLLTVIDSNNGNEVIAKHEEAQRQVGLADTIIFSKLDQLDETQRSAKFDQLKQFYSRQNPAASFLEKTRFLENLNLQFNKQDRRYDLPDIAHHHHHHNVNRHSEKISAFVLTYDKPIEQTQLDMFLDLLLSAHGDHVLRIKGLANIIGMERPVVVQAVGRNLSDYTLLKAWPDDYRSTRLVVFLDGMDGSFVKRLFDGFMNVPSIDTPDKAALTDNPLAIPGFGRDK